MAAKKEYLQQMLRKHIGKDEIRIFKIMKVSDLSFNQLQKIMMERNLKVDGSRESMESDVITSLGCDEVDIFDNVAIESLSIAELEKFCSGISKTQEEFFLQKDEELGHNEEDESNIYNMRTNRLYEELRKRVGKDEIRIFKIVKVSDLSFNQLQRIMMERNLEVDGSRESMESDLITSLGCDEVDIIDNVAIESLSIAELEKFCSGIFKPHANVSRDMVKVDVGWIKRGIITISRSIINILESLNDMNERYKYLVEKIGQVFQIYNLHDQIRVVVTTALFILYTIESCGDYNIFKKKALHIAEASLDYLYNLFIGQKEEWDNEYFSQIYLEIKPFILEYFKYFIS